MKDVSKSKLQPTALFKLEPKVKEFFQITQKRQTKSELKVPVPTAVV